MAQGERAEARRPRARGGAGLSAIETGRPTATTLRAARVRVPASTSNLGAGFDCIGLAVRRHLYAEYDPGPAGPGRPRIERDGTLAALKGAPEDDLLARAFRDRLRERGITDGPPGTLRVRSEIPIGRGLGSSAAALVGGLALADAVAGATAPDTRTLLARAAAAEGHPDNAAPALLGGLVAVVTDTDGVLHPLRPPLSDALGLAYAAPGTRVPTAAARMALPRSVPHATAARAAGRVAALLHGLAHADAEALRIGFADEIHVPYRLPLIQGAESAIAAGREAGAWAVTVSGAGSGLIAACPPEIADAVAHAMADAFRAAAGEHGVVAFAARPDREGLRVEVEPAGAGAVPNREEAQ